MRDTEQVSVSLPSAWSPLPPQWRSRAFAHAGSVLFESSQPSATQHQSFLFQQPHRILTAHQPEELPHLFASIEDALQQGHWVAGWLTYEAGYHFLDLATPHTDKPLAVFGIYSAPEVFDHTASVQTEPTEATQRLNIAPMPTVDVATYHHNIQRIQQWIAAGDTYQVNYTIPLTTPCPHTPQQVYEALQTQQPCSFGAATTLLPHSTILSLSPELFFSADTDGTLSTRPMKGTAPRSADEHEDQQIAEALRNDEKNRAEHVMIVDLLRNDMNRICRDVHVHSLFDIESLPTVHQMTSTIRGQLPEQTPWYDVFRALFPGGSITGAPKRHTVELIRQLEPSPRGVYTGAIGYIAPNRAACFNIAIRTATLANNTLTLNAGGGIVADSTAASEYNELLLKTAFVQRAAQPIQLIETIRVQNGHAPLLPHHLQRLSTSAEALGFTFHHEPAEARIQAAITAHASPQPQRLRLLLHRDGTIENEFASAPAWPVHVTLLLSSQRTHADAPYLRHKTTVRPEYQTAHGVATSAGFQDMLFCNTADEVTETCIANLLVRIHGRWYTPPLHSGVLPGVYRNQLLANAAIEERTITLADLHKANHVAVCNALRGVATVTMLQLPNGNTLQWEPASLLPTLSAW